MVEKEDVELKEITPNEFNGDEQDDPKAESSTVKEEAKAETKEPEVEVEESKDESEETETEGEAEADAEADADETETNKPRGAEERKDQLNTEIRDLVSQRNQLRDEVTKANSEVYQPATEDELIDQGYEATDAKIEALRQSIEMKDYNDKVAEAQLSISSESQRVLSDFEWANSESPNYNKELADEAAEFLQANLILDPNSGQVIGSNVSPYKIYKTLNKASSISTTKGQIKGQEATEKMLANADNSSTTTSAKPKVDPLTELWSEEL